MKLGTQKILETSDLYPLADERTSHHLIDDLELAWSQESKLPNPELFHALRVSYFWKWFPIGIYRFISDMGTNFSPLLLRYLIEFVQQTATPNPPPMAHGLSYAIGLFLVQIYISVVQNHFFHLALSQALEIKSAFIGMIFRKATKLNTPSRRSLYPKITNMVSSDTQRIEQFLGFGHVIWTAPIQFIIITALLIVNLGWAALAGIVILILLLPIQKTMMGKLQAVRKEVAPVTDSRVQLIQEYLAGIRIIKFFGWEKSVLNQIEQLRTKEIGLVRKRGFTQAMVFAVGFSVPVFSTAAALILYSLTQTLDPARIFSSLALFNQLRFPLMFFPMAVVQFVEFKVGLQRIQELLLAPVLENRIEKGADNAVDIQNADFVWESNESVESAKESKDMEMQPMTEPTLKEISLSIPKGSLVVICGAVGSGKSSLLGSLLGDTKLVSGKVFLSGSLGYAPQQAWIQNATIKENILFGQPYNEEKYRKVLRDCALEPDLEILQDGDETEIGERGINLSGGQKQRVNLARLLYFESDIIMMDDPLSAVDTHVGRTLFEQCILKSMRGKTRILVTHQLHVLPMADYIVVMKEGRIAEQGSYESLMRDGKAFSELMNDYGISNKSDAADEHTDEPLGELKKKTETKTWMEKEERATGSVKAKVWKTYFFAAGGYRFVPFLLLGIAIVQAARVGTDAWLVVWSNNSINSFSFGAYVGVYLSIASGQVLGNYIMGILFAYFGTIAAQKLHKKAIDRILLAPVSFFDATPMGRIINRFSKDQDGIDNTLMDAFRMFIGMLVDALSVFIVIIYTTPWFAAPILPVGIIYWFIQRYYRATSRELKRIEAITRSPLYVHINETLDGISTIRAYGEESRFIKKVEVMLNETNSPTFLLISAARWMSVRLEALGATLVLFAALFGLFASNTGWFSPALFGLSMTYSLQVTGVLNWGIRQFTETEIAMNAVERVAHYGYELAQEAPHESEKKQEKWPTNGKIVFNDVSLRYGDDLPWVLKQLSFEVAPGEKVGIVGRTGSGKSSIIQGLFRMVEPTGTIEIDHVNTGQMGLNELRSGIGIIPQDPVLFSGTFRRNLDPFGEYSDAELWSALERANIKAKVTESGGLEGEIMEAGENLSVGQRQLVCLARALLKKPVVLVMDEATANVDFETDKIIQKCIREDLSKSTILTIAHRLVQYFHLEYDYGL
jgi:ABC-type multidrug transport system fused ATPase/permease subunit